MSVGQGRWRGGRAGSEGGWGETGSKHCYFQELTEILSFIITCPVLLTLICRSQIWAVRYIQPSGIAFIFSLSLLFFPPIRQQELHSLWLQVFWQAELQLACCDLSRVNKWSCCLPWIVFTLLKCCHRNVHLCVMTGGGPCSLSVSCLSRARQVTCSENTAADKQWRKTWSTG